LRAVPGCPTGKELAYAAEALGGTIHVKECSNGVLVPADAEIVLEGFIGPEVTDEGPFVDITGNLRSGPAPAGHRVHRHVHKPDFIYHSILPGGRRAQDLMGCPYEPKIYKAVAGGDGSKKRRTYERRLRISPRGRPDQKSTQGDGKNAIHGAFAAHTSLKHVVVWDEDIDPTDPYDVEYAIATPGERGIRTSW